MIDLNISRFTPKELYTFAVVCIFCVVTIVGLALSSGGGTLRVGTKHIEGISNLANISNSVYGVYGMYRFYDTLFELLVFSTAALGITLFSDMQSTRGSDSTSSVESHIVDTSASFLYPIIAIFGIYLAYSAHRGPGGGFAGGVIVGSGVLLLAIAIGADVIGERFYEETMKKVEYLILILVMAIVITGLYLPEIVYQGNGGLGFIILVNMAIGTKVFIGTWTVLHFFVKHRGEL